MHSLLFLPPRRLLGLAALLLLALPSLARAATLNVPAQYGTIQAAVNASADGDTVLVADGTYTGDGNVDVDFSGKNITVTSQHGPASTIIDCQASAATLSHRGFIIHSGELNATLSGFTITNGYQVENNSGPASGSGGGIFVGSITSGSSLTVSNCIITHCVADSGSIGGVGGGIYAQTNSAGAASTITITNCTITNNTAVFSGGGIENSAAGNATVTMTGCTITGNTAVDPYGPGVGSGGGAYNSTDSLVTVPGSGSITVSACTIANNTAAYIGGGVYNINNTYGTIALNNCTVTGNSAPLGRAGLDGGGGAYEYGGTQTVTNCSFTGNSGGGIHNSNAYLNNVILYGDTGGELANPGTAPLRNCDVQGGLPAGATDGGGNIAADPLWVNAPGDLHLQAGSPCIGAGLLIAGVLTDKDGKTRPNPPSIGAYEGPPGTQVATTVTFTSALNPAPVGQAIPITVVVSNGTQTPPTGTLDFTQDGVDIGTAPLDANGRFVSTITDIGVGVHIFTATYSGNAHNQSSVGSLTQVVIAAPVHVLWNNVSGQASLWSIAPDGTVTGTPYGPFTNYTATLLADGPDGHSHILWNKTDGTIALWDIAPGANPTGGTYGPFPGYTASALAVGPDNHVHILWDKTDGSVALWDIAPGGNPTGMSYGPFAGYTASALTVGSDSHTHLLWKYTDGSVSLWDIAPGANPTGATYGPFAGYSAAALSSGPNGDPHILWDNTSGAVALWDIAAGGVPSGQSFGPFGGWTATALSVGADGDSHLLWDNTSGQITVWDIPAGGTPTGQTFGPFAGWTAVAVSVLP